MRFNMFVQRTGTVYGSLVCTECNKSVAYELEHHVDLGRYGEGAKSVPMLGSPKPPKEPRKKVNEDEAMNDQTL